MSSLTGTQAQYADQVFQDVALHQAEIVSKEFYDCRFVGCSFGEMIFKGCRFVHCVFEKCDLSLMRVIDCSFINTSFEDSRLIGVNWTEAAWPKKGLLNPLAFSRCSLSHSTFIGLKLKGITIKKCVARDVDFRDADLSQANMTYTDFSDSFFSNTDLTAADFSQAKNYNINVKTNMIKGAKFSLPEAVALLYSLDIVLVD